MSPKGAGLDPAVTVAIDSLPALPGGPAPLVVGDPSGRLAKALVAADAKPGVWLRRAGGHVAAAPWPEPGPFTAAYVRMPKVKDELAFLLGAASTVLTPAALLVVLGANDEGIRSAAPLLEQVAESVETISTRRHCRVIAGRRRADITDTRRSLADWREAQAIDLGDGPRRWITYPGLFARGRLDDGTRLLLQHLPPIAPDARVLDYACGTGVIAAAVLQHQHAARLDLIDNDALAIEAARENVPGARLILADSLAAVAGGRYAAILSNPPVHEGVGESLAVLSRLVADAPRCLEPRGLLQIVVQRRVKVEPMLAAAFGGAQVVADDGRFRVWRAIRA